MLRTSQQYWLSSLQSRLQGVLPEDASKQLSDQLLEKELEGLLEACASLKQRINNRSPIISLPPDIMEDIFFLVASDFAWEDGDSDLGWLSVTHVCRYWRRIALARAGLWTRIGSCATATMAAEYLSRSKSAPVSLTIHDSGRGEEELSDMVDCIRSHAWHMQRLNLGSPSLPTLLQLLVTTAMPVLRSFAAINFSRRTLRLELPESFFGSHAPTLTHLKFHLCSLPHFPAAFSHIKSLTLTFSYEMVYSHESPLFDTARAIGTELPHLEHLSITDGFPDLMPSPEVSKFLPGGLKSLDLRALQAPMRPLNIFVGAIEIPTSSHVSLEIHTVGDVAPITSTVTAFLGGNSPSPEVLHIRNPDPHAFVVEAWKSCHDYFPGAVADVSIRDYRGRPHLDLTGRNFLALIRHGRLGEVADLLLHLDAEQLFPKKRTPSDCFIDLHWARKVHRVTLIAPFLPFILALMETKPFSTVGMLQPDASEVVLFPLLDTLVLSCVPGTDSLSLGEASVQCLVHEVLPACLKTRRKHGAPIVHLHVPREWEDSVEGIKEEISSLHFL